MKFELFSRRGLRGKRWYFRIRAANGEPIAQSEAYVHKDSAIRTIELIKREAHKAVCRER
jgi:uncharacterized protein YegP (UPF0339 family)